MLKMLKCLMIYIYIYMKNDKETLYNYLNEFN